MNWEAIGAFGEVAGALVVIISVIYLATQVRQNTATTRAEAMRTFSIEMSRQFGEWGADPRSSMLWNKVIYEQVHRSDMSRDDAMSASFLIVSRLSLYDAAYRSYKEGILSEAEFRPMLTTRILTLPFTVDSWPVYRKELSPDFVDYMEKEFQILKEAQDNTGAFLLEQ